MEDMDIAWAVWMLKSFRKRRFRKVRSEGIRSTVNSLDEKASSSTDRFEPKSSRRGNNWNLSEASLRSEEMSGVKQKLEVWKLTLPINYNVVFLVSKYPRYQPNLLPSDGNQFYDYIIGFHMIVKIPSNTNLSQNFWIIPVVLFTVYCLPSLT